jgi:hypothetical protein
MKDEELDKSQPLVRHNLVKYKHDERLQVTLSAWTFDSYVQQ